MGGSDGCESCGEGELLGREVELEVLDPDVQLDAQELGTETSISPTTAFLRTSTHLLYNTVETQSIISTLCTVEPPIKDTIEITSEQRTRFNLPNGDFPIVLNLR